MRQVGEKTQAIWHGTVLAESADCHILAGVHYFPPDSVNQEALRPSDYRTQCPSKGTAHYYDLVVDGRTNPAAAWYYPKPRSGFKHLKNYVAFWNGVRVAAAGAASADGVSAHAHSDQGELLEFLLSVPKTEIHLHLEATAGAAEIYQLMSRNEVQIPGVATFEDLLGRFQVRNLSEFIALFIDVLQPVVQHEEDFAVLIAGARNYLLRNNIPYAELFFAPSSYLRRGLDFQRITDVIERETARARDEHDVHMRYLVDVSRSFGPENAMQNVKLTKKHRNEYILGIGLGGAEATGPAKDYVDAFAAARDAGLRAVAHAGEDVGPESIIDTLDLLKAERIGHGLSAMLDEKLMDRLAESQIPVECCPSSNVLTRRFVQSLDQHPLPTFLDRGINASLNTDDPAIFGVDLIDEFMNAHNYMGIDRAQIIRLIENGINSTFLSDDEKAQRLAAVAAASGAVAGD